MFVGLLGAVGTTLALSCGSTGGGWRCERNRAVSWELLPAVSPVRFCFDRSLLYNMPQEKTDSVDSLVRRLPLT